MGETEPVRVSAAVEFLLMAIFPALIAFDLVSMTAEQVAYLEAAIIAVVKFVGAIVTRSLVWSPASVNELLRNRDNN